MNYLKREQEKIDQDVATVRDYLVMPVEARRAEAIEAFERIAYRIGASDHSWPEAQGDD